MHQLLISDRSRVDGPEKWHTRLFQIYTNSVVLWSGGIQTRSEHFKTSVFKSDTSNAGKIKLKAFFMQWFAFNVSNMIETAITINVYVTN